MVLRLTQSTTYHRSPFSSVQYSEARSLCERYMGRRTVRSNLWCFCEPSSVLRTRRFAITGDIDGNLSSRKIFADDNESFKCRNVYPRIFRSLSA